MTLHCAHSRFLTGVEHRQVAGQGLVLQPMLQLSWLNFLLRILVHTRAIQQHLILIATWNNISPFKTQIQRSVWAHISTAILVSETWHLARLIMNSCHFNRYTNKLKHPTQLEEFTNLCSNNMLLSLVLPSSVILVQNALLPTYQNNVAQCCTK